MASSPKPVLFVNVLFWLVAGLLHPVASLLPAGNGEPPKFFTFLIPLAFVALAFGSTVMMAKALAAPKKSS